jgi:glycosyltransferase involved in cell wall biosynthesis
MNQDIIKVSIVIPVYKVEKYLRKCLDSVVAQTYKNIEVILVDDGSPDDCGRICDEYAEIYSFIKVIHQNNQGLSAARNNAVPQSTGEFITFIDSDDFVTPDYVEYLVSLMKKNRAEISVGGTVYQYEKKPIKAPKEETKTGFCSVEKALINMNYGQDFSVYAWGKLYKRELVERNPYPVGKLYEDLANTYIIVSSSNGVAYGNKQIYYWLQRAGSIMHSGFNEKQFDGIDAVNNQLAFVAENYPNAIQAAKVRYMAKIAELMSIAFQSTNSESIYKRLKSEMRYYNEVMADPKVKKSLKIRLVALKSGYYPAKTVFAVHEKLKQWLI